MRVRRENSGFQDRSTVVLVGSGQEIVDEFKEHLRDYDSRFLEKNQSRSQGGNMRSEYVFAAVKEIENRFMLCRVASASARRLHIDSTRPSDTINKSLNLIAAGSTTIKTASPDAHAAIAQPVATSE